MVCVAHVAVLLLRFGFTVLLFLLRSLVSMNFTVVYIYTAEVCPLSAAGVGSSVLCFVVLVSLETLFFSPGVSHRGPLSGDGLLHFVQSDRRNDRSIHRSGECRVQLTVAVGFGSTCGPRSVFLRVDFRC